MKTQFRMTLALILLNLVMVFSVACSESIFSNKGGGKKGKNAVEVVPATENPPVIDGDGRTPDNDDDNDSDDDDNAGNKCPGLENYHQLYASIQEAIVKVKRVEIRTNKREVIEINVTPFEIDLSQLNGLLKGFPLDLRNVQLPENVSELDVVEIALELYQHGRLGFDNEADCKLKTDKQIVFYLTQPYRLSLGEQYLVKVPFDALHSIQLNVSGGSRHKFNLPNYADEIVNVLTGQHHGGSDDKKCNNHHEKDCSVRCELANRRAEVTDITRLADEF